MQEMRIPQVTQMTLSLGRPNRIRQAAICPCWYSALFRAIAVRIEFEVQVQK